MSRDKQNIKTTDWLTRGMTKEEIAREKAKAIKEAEAELRDKQIEEMAQAVCELYKEFGSCEACDAELDIGGEPCIHECFAKAFYNAGYRKASDVAEEIFAEIEKILKTSEKYLYCNPSLASVNEVIAELKKKYIGEDRDKLAEFGKYSPLSWKYTESENNNE